MRNQHLFIALLLGIAVFALSEYLIFFSLHADAFFPGCCSSPFNTLTAPQSIPKLLPPELDWHNNDLLHLHNDNPEYSKVACFRGEQQECWNGDRFLPIDWRERRCIFRNVGLESSSDGIPSFVFHVDPKQLVLWDSNFGTMNFTVDPAVLFEAFGVRFRFDHSPAVYAQQSYDRAWVFAKYEMTHLSNDHLFVWQLFESMANAGMLSTRNEWVVFGEGVPRTPKDIWKVISSRPPRSLASIAVPKLLSHVMLANRPVHLVSSPFSQENIALLFRDRAYAIWGLDLSLVNTKPVVGIAPGVLCRDELLDVFSRCCQAKVDGLDSIDLVSKLDVLVAVLGSEESLLSPFLRDGSSAIYGGLSYVFTLMCLSDFPSSVKSTAGEFNGTHLFTSFPHFRKVHVDATWMNNNNKGECTSVIKAQIYEALVWRGFSEI